MKSRLDLADLNLHRIKQVKTLTKLLAKSSLFQEAPITVVHNLSHYKRGEDYIVELFENGQRGLIRGYEGKVQLGDHIILPNGVGSVRFQVENIEYYADSPNLWVVPFQQDSAPKCLSEKPLRSRVGIVYPI